MKTFYAVNLNKKYSGTSRWALYELVEEKGALEVVWCNKLENGEREALLPNQVASKLKGYPAYHFVAQGFGICHLDQLAYGLADHYKTNVSLLELSYEKSGATKMNATQKILSQYVLYAGYIATRHEVYQDNIWAGDKMAGYYAYMCLKPATQEEIQSYPRFEATTQI